MGRLLPSAVVLFACAAMAIAQTFVVDASNGPGTNFTDLPTAVNTVPDGAVLDVRPGSYAPFAIVSKGLSVLFEPGASVLLSGGEAVVSASGTAAQQTIVLRGVRIDPNGNGSLHVVNCQGLVTLADCSFPHSSFVGRLFVVSNSVQVEAARCVFGLHSVLYSWNQGAASFANSSVVLRSCTLGDCLGDVVTSTSCRLQCLDTTITVHPAFLPSGFGVAMQGGDLRMVGGSVATDFTYGIGGSGVARIDPSVAFWSAGGGTAGPAAPTVQATFAVMPAVTATDGPLGGSLTVDLRGPAGDFGVLLAGLPGPPLSFPGIADPSWMLPGTEVVCATAFLAAGAHLVISVPVPNLASLRGTRIVWQGASFGAANGLQASNPAVTTHW